MTERTLDIRPLNEPTINWIRSSLQKYPEVIRMQDEQYFSVVGTFNLTETRDPFSRSYPLLMWSPILLEFDPEHTKLTTYKGQLIVRDQQDKVLKSIPPENIRKVSIEAEMGDVHKSGYVLGNHLYSLRDIEERLNREDFANILEQADDGQKPPGFDFSTRVKVNPVLVGKKLWICVFEFELDRNVWDRDAVVIDPQTRTMIEREVTRPLSRERWIK